MQDCYVTPTLINSWLYYIKSREEYEETAKADFLNCLNKIKTEPTEAMLRGIKFEDDVLAQTENRFNAAGCKPEYAECVKQIAEQVEGGIWQETVQKEIKVGDLNVLVYGRTDVIKENKIIDIKFVKKYELGKYHHSVQHPFYMYGSGIENFTYWVSDGKNVYPEDYRADQTLSLSVASIINEFFIWLKSANYYETYLEKWKGKN